MVKLKPFIKWAGGKGKLLPQIRQMYPQGLGKTITKYAEPFVGGGAVLFDIISTYRLEQIYISDINKNLINTYNTVKNNHKELIEILSYIETQYLSLNADMQKKFYYLKRDEYNNMYNTCNIQKAALLIFLNKTCFNGLYRVNKNNMFNVPAGKYKNPKIYSIENISAISEALKYIDIIAESYTNVYEFADEKTFIYFDPPYRPLTNTSSFTAYTDNNFGDKEQISLAEFIEKIEKKGTYILLSNSDPHNIDNSDMFFDNLYCKKKINRIYAPRMINSKGNNRDYISELLISNY
ncbi:DNA adenine methylase [Mucispirillum schaedleri]|jgi:DNA adenine methylase|uniref:Site-specific DNA-methyltransferase (adenine-specific) n=1 Tax=Mucispirillum schaedleri ASF457 TaxID=1379858 RepID=V2RL74_9BACT|nr:Dam family site-specific DNA-(adenine-N6)-methyltransferase [Mucispirillum schaedleri]MCX4360827.1 Dam family site-specific DNA-(adenine-N6)-methyltransferase [Mucispirillum schaedleri]USF24135.1 Modification methylase DpnIIA [Mucispirillum schaedleri ASF457]SIW06186.1 Modification methylase MjaIII [Mucispirillum schaedleri ASF457]